MKTGRRGWLLALGFLATGPVQADGFLSCVDGVPLAPGLAEAEDSCLNFDTAAGRVAQAEARGTPTIVELRRFYREALPAFGWTLGEGDLLDAARPGERLHITFEVTPSGETRVHYALAPSP